MCVEKKREGRGKIDREADDQQVLLLEEKDVVSSVATVLSDLCGPGDWMPMEKLHSVVSDCYLLLSCLLLVQDLARVFYCRKTPCFLHVIRSITMYTSS